MRLRDQVQEGVSQIPNVHALCFKVGRFKGQDGGHGVKIFAQLGHTPGFPSPNLRGHPLHAQGGMLTLPQSLGEPQVEAGEVNGQDEVGVFPHHVRLRPFEVLEDGGEVLGHLEKAHEIDRRTVRQEAHALSMHAVSTPAHEVKYQPLSGANLLEFSDQKRPIGISGGFSSHQKDFEASCLTQGARGHHDVPAVA